MHNFRDVQVLDNAGNVAVLFFERHLPARSNETQFLDSAALWHVNAHFNICDRDVGLSHPSSRRIFEAHIGEKPKNQISLG